MFDGSSQLNRDTGNIGVYWSWFNESSDWQVVDGSISSLPAGLVKAILSTPYIRGPLVVD